MMHARMLPFLISFLILILFSCTGRELKSIGETRISEETYFYGQRYVVRAYKVLQDDLDELRKDLKNDLSARLPKDGRKQWDEISSLKIADAEYFLFELIPETRLLPEFLSFRFDLSGQSPIKTWSYYVFLFNIKSKNSTPAVYPITTLGSYPFYYGYSSRYEPSVQTETEHTYKFLLMFSKQNSIAGKRIRATSPQGKIYEFEIN
ncbi:putative lipoprotein [Leptospira fainei serovar Hurstbridge str. BUT 6]|uniref:Lipoprotein n=1 Tax=Leptospira fainei serovar Hurstbridge str. BUT 6 TaxID=1193011 RepID=S3VCE0_9LEPT|nr:hypothetical protein [Leptospira fainei]EPG74130.1 putative lipoprotein [Leptospira fainei serovar Hurstbridge str. BUT 6]